MIRLRTCSHHLTNLERSRIVREDRNAHDRKRRTSLATRAVACMADSSLMKVSVSVQSRSTWNHGPAANHFATVCAPDTTSVIVAVFRSTMNARFDTGLRRIQD